MKKYLAALLFVSTAGYAQFVETQKPVICAKPEIVFKELAATYNERIFWAGKGEETTYLLWVNSKTNSWTLVQSTKALSCIIGTGTNNNFLLGNQL